MGKIIKGLTFNEQLDFAYVEFDDVFKIAKETHNVSGEKAKYLGQILAVGGYMTSFLKNSTDNMSINLRLKKGYNLNYFGDGNGNIKACINDAEIGETCKITVIKDLGLKNIYSGSCFFDGEILIGLKAYYSQSEQIFIDFKIEVNEEENKLRAIFYQCLPSADGESIDYVLENVEKSVAEQLELFKKDGFYPTEKQMNFKCLCSSGQIDKVLISVGKKECEEIIKERGNVEVICHFCNKKYTYDKKMIEELFKDV